jgi:hypothetical protein
MSRLDKTLADYVAIAISPALIMLMVGSLMWFLVAVFYQGSYDGRIYWILACYVFAIVLITRIAIEEGRERAALFGVALAGAVGLATMRFSSSMYFHWILLAVAWWAAHKLTMDCTLIDEEQDSSGQGLLQVVGFGKKRAEKDENREPANEKKEETPTEPEGVTERVGRMREEAHPKRQTKGKAHAPGVWIVYFSLAALPLFGLGQMLVPVSDAGRRLWTFQLLCTYVAAGLGLLVTTSFVGLRRYLRQRGVQMPPEMAGVWIALGAALIVALLAVCAILPRPAAEYEIARMPDFPLKFTTPDRESNRYAMGEEGADQNDPDSQSYTQGEQDGNRPEGGKSDDPESGGKEGSRAKEGAGTKKSSDGKARGSSKGDKKEESGSKQDSSSEQQNGSSKSQDRHSPSDEQQPGGDKQESTGDKQQSSGDQKQRSDDRQRGGEKQQSSDEKQSSEASAKDSADDRNKSEPTESDEGRPEDESAESRKSDEERSDSRKRSEDAREDSRQPRDRREDAGSGEEEEEKKEEEERSERAGSRSPGPSEKPNKPPFQLPQVRLSGGLLGMLKFLVYIVLGCAGLYWLWKNWSRVVEGFRLFLQELRDLWARLFGGKPESAAEEAEEERPSAKPERPFNDYVDPFAAGLAARYAPAELVRYTFEATEAWARENGCPREPDQTPHEFAARVGGRVESLRGGAVALARLYCQAAYAPGTLAAEGLAPLGDFWQGLRASHGMVVQPPPVQPVG